MRIFCLHQFIQSIPYVDFPTDRNRHRRGRGRQARLCAPSGKKNERIVTGAHFLCFPGPNLNPQHTDIVSPSELEIARYGCLDTLDRMSIPFYSTRLRFGL